MLLKTYIITIIIFKLMLPYQNQYMLELVRVKQPNINIIPLEKKKIKII